MTYIDQSKGLDPQGQIVSVPIAGISKVTIQPLNANQVWDSGWMPVNGANSIHYSISSDVSGSYTVQYSLDGQIPVSFMPGVVVYDPAQGLKEFQSVFAPKGNFIKFTYTNGPAPQTTFFLEVRFGPSTQNTMRSLGANLNSTNLASVQRGPIEATDGTSYKQITRTGDSLNVNVTNSVGTIKIDQTSLDALEQITVKVDQSSLDALENITVMGTVGINNFPTGGSTETTLSAINTKTPPLGQKAMAASSPIVIASDQTAIPVNVSNFPSSQAVTGGFLTDTQLRASAVPVSGPVTDTQLRATPLPVSGTVTANSPVNSNIFRSGNFYQTGIATSTTFKVLSGYEVFSPNARVYLWLYNKATAPNTATDNPIDYITIPQATVLLESQLNLGGFTSGISFALSLNPPTGTTAPYGYSAPTNSQYIQVSLRGRVS